MDPSGQTNHAALEAQRDGDRDLDRVLAGAITESGANLLALARDTPILLVFLRHFGCSFCRQTLADLAQLRGELETRGIRPVFVHLATPERARPYFTHYRLADAERISDPAGSLYRHPAFRLPRVHFLLQFAVPRVWARWLGGVVLHHGIGLLREDAHQMPGLFYVKDLRIARSYRYRTIADTPDYLKLVS